MARFIYQHHFIVTVLLSLVISIWTIATNDIIARDSVLYLKTAQYFLDNGIEVAFDTYNWAFYSLFIAFIHQITHLTLEHSAYLNTLIMEALCCVTFIKIVHLIHPKKALWIALLFILTFPIFNEYRGGILRGSGFWAFSLIALYQFLLFYQSGHIHHALFWQIAIFIAFLFRPEALVFAFLAPFYFIFLLQQSWRWRLRQILLLNSLLYPLGLILISLFLFSSEIKTGVLHHLPIQLDYLLIQKVSASFSIATENFAKYVLPFDYSKKYSTLILSSGLLMMLFYRIISSFGFIYTGIAIQGIYKKQSSFNPLHWIIIYFIGIALLIVIVFVGSRLFISPRYLVLLSLLLGLLVIPYIETIYQQFKISKNRFALKLFYGYFILISLHHLVSISAKKTPIKEASFYFNEIQQQGETVACNEPRFEYYTHFSCRIVTTWQEAARHDYLLLWLKPKQFNIKAILDQDKTVKLITSFHNKTGSEALLYSIAH